MENLNENITTQKQRHGCVTAWLVIMIILNSLLAVVYLFASDFITNNLQNSSKSMILLLGVLGVLNVVFAVMLLKWKKLGFWGFIASSIIVMFINLTIGMGVGQSVFGLVGVAILYGILQIKSNNVTTWDNLE